MRIIYLLLSISVLLVSGTYSATTLWPNYFADENHEPLDHFADEIISHTELGRAIDRSLDSVELYLKNDATELAFKDRERLASLMKTNKDSYRATMRDNLKSILMHTLTREELIEVSKFYQKESGQKFSGILSSPEERQALTLPWRQLNQYQGITPVASRAPASSPSHAPSPVPSPAPKPSNGASVSINASPTTSASHTPASASK